MPAERLQKIIAAAGIASRRKAEQLIAGGLVSVNGQIVTELGSKADPEHDHIKVNGKLLSGAERPVYLLLHKPKGYVTTVTDPQHRPTVLDLVAGVKARVYPVGRLDYLSEGLLLLTNDGELAQKLTHASSHVPKTYVVKVSGKPSEEQIEKLRGGVMLRPERSPLKTPAGREPRVGQRTAIGGGADCAGAHPISARRRQSLVRDDAGGRPQPANPPDVRRDWTPRGEDQTRALWAAGAGCGAGKVAASDGEGSGAVESCSRFGGSPTARPEQGRLERGTA